MRKKLAIAGLLTLCIILGTGGCASMDIPLRDKEAKTYLENKYKESFTPYSAVSISIDQPYASMFFVSASHPNEPAEVIDDLREFRDDYFGILARARMQEILEEAVQKNLGNAKVFFRFTSRSFPDDCVDPADLDRFLLDRGQRFYINAFVFVADGKAEKTAWDGLCEALKKRGINATIMCCSVRPQDFQGLTAETCDDYLSAHPDLPRLFTSYLR